MILGISTAALLYGAIACYALYFAWQWFTTNYARIDAQKPQTLVATPATTTTEHRPNVVIDTPVEAQAEVRQARVRFSAEDPTAIREFNPKAYKPLGDFEYVPLSEVSSDDSLVSQRTLNFYELLNRSTTITHGFSAFFSAHDPARGDAASLATKKAQALAIINPEIKRVSENLSAFNALIKALGSNFSSAYFKKVSDIIRIERNYLTDIKGTISQTRPGKDAQGEIARGLYLAEHTLQGKLLALFRMHRHFSPNIEDAALAAQTEAHNIRVAKKKIVDESPLSHALNHYARYGDEVSSAVAAATLAIVHYAQVNMAHGFALGERETQDLLIDLLAAKTQFDEATATDKRESVSTFRMLLNAVEADLTNYHNDEFNREYRIRSYDEMLGILHYCLSKVTNARDNLISDFNSRPGFEYETWIDEHVAHFCRLIFDAATDDRLEFSGKDGIAIKKGEKLEQLHRSWEDVLVASRKIARLHEVQASANESARRTPSSSVMGGLFGLGAPVLPSAQQGHRIQNSVPAPIHPPQPHQPAGLALPISRSEDQVGPRTDSARSRSSFRSSGSSEPGDVAQEAREVFVGGRDGADEPRGTHQRRHSDEALIARGSTPQPVLPSQSSAEGARNNGASSSCCRGSSGPGSRRKQQPRTNG